MSVNHVKCLLFQRYKREHRLLLLSSVFIMMS